MTVPRRSIVVMLATLVVLAIGLGGSGIVPTAANLWRGLPDRLWGQPAEPLPPEDGSLPEADYLKLGVPSTDHPWSSGEVVKAVGALEQLGKRNPSNLPRRGSRRSGRVFDRLVAPDIADYIRGPRGSPLLRSLPTLTYPATVNRIVVLYNKAQARRAAGGAEQVEVAGLLLRTLAATLQLSREMNGDDDDPEAGTVVPSLRKTVRDLISADLKTVADREGCRTEDRARLVGYLGEALPTLVLALDPEQADAVLTRLGELRGDPRLANLGTALDDLDRVTRLALDRAEE